MLLLPLRSILTDFSLIPNGAVLWEPVNAAYGVRQALSFEVQVSFTDSTIDDFGKIWV